MDKATLYTFKQRAQELIKALKRRHTEERQAELDRIKEIIDNLEEK